MEIILENKGDSVFRCTYRPVIEGPHAIHVLFGGQEIPKSPFAVNIAEGEPSLPISRPQRRRPSAPVKPRRSILVPGDIAASALRT